MLADPRPSARVTLVNLVSMEEMEALCNPEILKARVAVNYASQEIVGMSHQLLQYSSTGNTELTEVEFFVDARIAKERGFVSRQVRPDLPGSTVQFESYLEAFLGFMLALTAPPSPAGDISSGSPPEVLFVWPGAGVSLRCRVTSLEYEFRQFATSGKPLVYMCTASFVESRDQRISSHKLRYQRFQRAEYQVGED